MLHEISWLARRLDELRDAAQHVRWELSALQDTRHEVAPVWDDTCSREMSRRFLDPMADEASASLAEMDRQIAGLDSCTVALQTAAAALATAAQDSAQVRQIIMVIMSIFKTMDAIHSGIEYEASQSIDYQGEAVALLAQADSAGA